MAGEKTNKQSRVRVIEENKFIFSTQDTCQFFTISRETLSRWEKKRRPKSRTGEMGHKIPSGVAVFWQEHRKP